MDLSSPEGASVNDGSLKYASVDDGLGRGGEGGCDNTTLPFGLRSVVADAAEWIIRQEGVNFIVHYLDDYMVLGE